MSLYKKVKEYFDSKEPYQYGHDFIFSPPVFVGVAPVRQDIETIPADTPRQITSRFWIKEKIGAAVINTRAIDLAHALWGNNE